MTTRSSLNHELDDHGVRSLVAASVLLTLRDAAKAIPPRGCTPHEWYQARLLVKEWEADYGVRLSDMWEIANEPEHPRPTQDKKENEEMATKQAATNTGSDLVAMEHEAENLRGELGTITQALDDGEGSVAELESSIIRQQAINLRLKALSAKMDAERARLKEIKQQENKEAARLFKRQADEHMDSIINPLLEAYRIAMLAKTCESKAASLTEFGSSVGPGYRAVQTLTHVIARIAPDRFYGTDFGNRLVDKEARK